MPTRDTDARIGTSGVDVHISMTFGRQSDTVVLGIAENMIGFISPPRGYITCRSPTGKAQGPPGQGPSRPGSIPIAPEIASVCQSDRMFVDFPGTCGTARRSYHERDTAKMTTASTRITILIDNQAVAGCEAEHGFSLWLETEGRRILFDTGQGESFIRNAETLGIDPGLTDTIVPSHGHYDHSGGLPQLLRRARKADLYCHPAAVSARYSIRNGRPRNLRMPSTSLIALDRLPLEQLHWLQRPQPLTGCIGLSGPIPRVSGFEDTGGPFYLDRQGLRADPIDDDLALWVRTGGGLIVIVGCAHAGLVKHPAPRPAVQ